MAEAASNPFSPRVVAAVVLGGVVAFLGFLVLLAYAPQLKLRTGEGSSPMSRSAVGFYGLYRLSEASGRPTELNSERADWTRTGFTLVVVTPATELATLRDLVRARRRVEDSRTLYIMPKWITMPLPTNSRWVQRADLLPANWSPQLIEVFGRISFGQASGASRGRVRGVADGEVPGIDVPAPRSPRYVASGLTPVLVDEAGRTILGRIDLSNGAADYILADPDLLSNMALKTPEGARAALAILDAMRADSDDSVAFDVALNGLGNGRNLLLLMFEPPFLALTLAVLAAAALVGGHAIGRFGPAQAEARAIPFGKRALADNAAVLIGRAGAVKRLGDRYVAHIRDTAAHALGATKLDPDALERWFATLRTTGPGFGVLASDARTARDSQTMRAAARALHDWKEEVTRDRR